MCQSYNVTATYQSGGVLLDTLEKGGYSPNHEQREALVKRVIQKVKTQENTYKLIDQRSPLEKAYWNTWHCGNVILQDGDVYRSDRCRKRWCIRCSHIRTMHLIHGYKHLLEEFEEPVMLTLTMKNCKGRELKAYYKKMIEAFKRATRNARKTHGINCKGIRNWECTYNAKEDEFHPHFHVFLNSKKEAELIRDYWMKDWQKRVGKKHISQKGQKITHVQDEQGLLEVFKYATKMSVDLDQEVQAQDWIYQVTKGKNLTQPFGGVKKAKEAQEPQKDVQRIEGAKNKEIWAFELYHENYLSASGEFMVLDQEKEDYIQAQEQKKKKRNAKKELPTQHPNNAKRALSPKSVLPQERTNRIGRNEDFMAQRN